MAAPRQQSGVQRSLRNFGEEAELALRSADNEQRSYRVCRRALHTAVLKELQISAFVDALGFIVPAASGTEDHVLDEMVRAGQFQMLPVDEAIERSLLSLASEPKEVQVASLANIRERLENAIALIDRQAMVLDKSPAHH